MKRSDASTPKLERKAVEKNRRIHMKNLCSELSSLIPPEHPSRVALSQQDSFEQAADYIKKTEERIKELKRKRDSVMDVEGRNRDMSGGMMMGLRLPIVELSESGSILKVVMISGLDNNVMLSDIITVLEEGS
ncbi:transcription factor bHLH162-like protein isoform X1 [Cinnamomum micranthum f. kanehirae]|uniref:Transcription factor bHLH162-like protein isoform X1 n=1 Tax=Cinnamomum micranthum f. kanehirae TaxID=337451 RepID=A0A3S3N7P6_9MAGN|nr:transcription factor bHLH162-like protein isoform X1 [Cinnamomum micranthum f. kanehirae]